MDELLNKALEGIDSTPLPGLAKRKADNDGKKKKETKDKEEKKDDKEPSEETEKVAANSGKGWLWAPQEESNGSGAPQFAPGRGPPPYQRYGRWGGGGGGYPGGGGGGGFQGGYQHRKFPYRGNFYGGGGGGGGYQRPFYNGGGGYSRRYY